jgi:mercuric ion binding protein
MKTLRYALAVLVITASMVSCKNETAPETKTVSVETQKEEKKLNPDADYLAIDFEIEGMSCAMGCAKVIEKNLAKMDGVKSVKVDFESKTANIEYDAEMTSQESIIATVKRTGDVYEVTTWNGERILEAEEPIVE